MKAPARTIRVIGHRGSPSTHRENTIAAFRAAEAGGADGIEIDVHCCADRTLVVHHDATLGRVFAGSAAIADLTYAELLSAMPKDAQIPKLTDVFESVRLPIQIELKDDRSLSGVAELLAGRADWAQRSVLSSFDTRRLTVIKKLLDTAGVQPAGFGVIAHRWTRELMADAVDLGADQVFVGWQSLTTADIREAHDAGLELVLWTVNTAEEWSRAVGLDVDGVTTDAPAAIVREREVSGR